MTMATTSPQVGESGDAAERPLALLTWGEHAAHFAGVMAGYAEYGSGRGDLAALRRMDPDSPDVAAFWRLLASRGLLERSTRETERKWALILHGIALMTRNAGDNAQARSAHDRNASVGRALFAGGDSQRGGNGYYSELRFNRLLSARGEMLRYLLARAFRMLAADGAKLNWYEMAQFIRYQDYDETRAENARRRIASEYYRAERRAAASAETGD